MKWREDAGLADNASLSMRRARASNPSGDAKGVPSLSLLSALDPYNKLLPPFHQSSLLRSTSEYLSSRLLSI